MESREFGFGIEAEFIIASNKDFAPLSHRDLNSDRLQALINGIQTADISTDGLNLKPLHTKISPYLLEGYYLTDENMKPTSLLAKGIEIRTPRTNCIQESLTNLQSLYSRLQEALATERYAPVILSHHPTEANLEAPPNYARHDYWQWALTATTTFGPDINISLPSEWSEKIDLAKLNAKINHYGPAAVALTLASPLVHGDLWHIRGRVGKSIRTYRRSIWAPLFYVHHKPSLRFEFKGFEMSQSLDDYRAFFLMSLAILTDDTLAGQASDQSRIYDLGEIAICGLESSITRQRAQYVLEGAEKIASRLSLQRTGLDEMWSRVDSNRVPADEIIEIYEREKSIPKTMKCLANFHAPQFQRTAQALPHSQLIK